MRNYQTGDRLFVCVVYSVGTGEQPPYRRHTGLVFETYIAADKFSIRSPTDRIVMENAYVSSGNFPVLVKLERFPPDKSESLLLPEDAEEQRLAVLLNSRFDRGDLVLLYRHFTLRNEQPLQCISWRDPEPLYCSYCGASSNGAIAPVHGQLYSHCHCAVCGTDWTPLDQGVFR